tara:strand:- start:380 stop:547 length:168 start_codon:yes stop_codon:yes gene_type:complete
VVKTVVLEDRYAFQERAYLSPGLLSLVLDDEGCEWVYHYRSFAWICFYYPPEGEC